MYHDTHIFSIIFTFRGEQSVGRCTFGYDCLLPHEPNLICGDTGSRARPYQLLAEPADLASSDMWCGENASSDDDSSAFTREAFVDVNNIPTKIHDREKPDLPTTGRMDPPSDRDARTHPDKPIKCALDPSTDSLLNGECRSPFTTDRRFR